MGGFFSSFTGKMTPSEARNGPSIENWPNFDQNYGFASGRKERVMKVTQAEVISAKIPMNKRGYCADLYINFLVCRKKNMPFCYRCAPEDHAYNICEFEDHVLRMKEYEREKRLLERSRRKARRAAREELLS